MSDVDAGAVKEAFSTFWRRKGRGLGKWYRVESESIEVEYPDCRAVVWITHIFEGLKDADPEEIYAVVENTLRNAWRETRSCRRALEEAAKALEWVGIRIRYEVA